MPKSWITIRWVWVKTLLVNCAGYTYFNNNIFYKYFNNNVKYRNFNNNIKYIIS